MTMSVQISTSQARRLWLQAQKLDVAEPFGAGPDATRAAIEHLGYVQIDTIHVIERCHHHILYARIPTYRRADLIAAQSIDKTVFEYWTHALSYVPVRDYRYFIGAMKQHRVTPKSWFASVTPEDVQKVLRLIRRDGPLSIRDIDDDVLVEKDHAWASRKPSKRALQLAFFTGMLTVSQRTGMLKSYDLSSRHFGWTTAPKAAPEKDVIAYMLDRAVRAQGLVSLDSICHLDAKRKTSVLKLIETRVREKRLVAVAVAGAERIAHWIEPQALDADARAAGDLVHILSPFDPLIIQRKRLQLFFDHDHRFEAYIPKPKRVFGYFALPVLVGDEVVAVIDLKTDRAKRELLVQQWTWIGVGAPRTHKRVIEEALHTFEHFQLG
jgi:uncharacterized protein